MTGERGQGWFEGAPCGLVATSFDGTILEVNETFLSWTGLQADDISGRSFASLLDPGTRLLYDTRHTQVLHLRGAIDEVAVTVLKADGTPMPVLLNAVRDRAGGIDRLAVFNATERVRYERELLEAKRVAESSERRVRVLQDISSAFGVSASDEDVAESFVAVASEAFAARESAVLLWREDGELVLVGGTNPVAGMVASTPALRDIPEVTVVHADDESHPCPEVVDAMRDARLASISITPLIANDERLGVLVCFFGRRADADAQFIDLQQAIGRQASQTLVRVRLQRRLAFLALHDQLTGCGNRQFLQLALDEAIASSAQTSDPLAVLFLDVDDFKSINDAFGHAAGDMVLVELADRLRSSIRTTDVVGRMGGDEFVAICANTDIAAAERVAARVLDTCRAAIAHPDGIISPSVSVGIAVYRPGEAPPPSAAHMLVRADAAMYDSKRSGKDRFTMSVSA